MNHRFVSILTQTSRLGAALIASLNICFQSSPKPLGWVQCYTGGRIAGACPGFNPHPNLSVGRSRIALL